MDLSGKRGNGLTFVLILVVVLVIDGFANAIVGFNMKHKLGCRTKSNLGIKLTMYDLSASSTGKTISCHEDFCASAISNSHGLDGACLVGSQYGYAITYGDGSKTAGDYVKDNFSLEIWVLLLWLLMGLWDLVRRILRFCFSLLLLGNQERYFFIVWIVWKEDGGGKDWDKV
ncbi:hypothetical protein LIER_16634 [Lithospermum erythrorhizon]|uniref:Xylanase inhibitor N-terminal domain-containing protein n=1 Tax=Lithospermum erythrorhizon TaxID=34254 RepID=A0AAV3Q9X1_LITER